MKVTLKQWLPIGFVGGAKRVIWVHHIESLFPGLSGKFRITSPATPKYNCIAWAADDPYRKWWPAPFCYWPRVTREATVPAFIEAYGTLGYKPCADGVLVAGMEKIAIYVNAKNVPLHAARQLESGKWTSKLGDLEDISHDEVRGLEGTSYGRVACYLSRPRQAKSK